MCDFDSALRTTLAIWRWLPWFPIFVLIATVICVSFPLTRRPSAFIFFVPLCSVLLCSSMLFGPLIGGAGLYRIMGMKAALTLGFLAGSVTGIWIGGEFARMTLSAFENKKIRWRITTLLGAGLLLYVFYAPIGFMEHAMGGGSGYGAGLPHWFMKLLETAYFPWMDNMYLIFRTINFEIAVGALNILFWSITFWSIYSTWRYLYKKRLSSNRLK